MSEVKLVPTIVFKYNYEPGFNVDKFKEHTKLHGGPGVSEDGGGITTAGNNDNPHFWPSMVPFLQWLHPKIEIALNEWAVAYDSYFISKSWANLHTRGGYTKPHEHGPGSVVVSIYVKQPQDGGNIMFESLLRDKWVAYSREDKHSNIHDYWREISVNTNDVLLFPGWINHKTQPSKTDEERIVFTINFGAVIKSRMLHENEIHTTERTDKAVIPKIK